jgi:hypothetical protein
MGTMHMRMRKGITGVGAVSGMPFLVVKETKDGPVLETRWPLPVIGHISYAAIAPMAAAGLFNQFYLNP